MTATLGYVTNWQVLQWMNGLIAGKSYVSLHFSDPGAVPDNPSATEVAGASYRRVKVTWKLSGARSLVSTAAVQWRALPETTVTHLGVFNDPYGGQMRAVMPRVAPMYVVSNGSFRLEAGDLYLRWP